LSRVKSINYLDNILARQEAINAHADDALLLNTQNKVAETTIANIFTVKNGAVFTPRVEDDPLPGIMRKTIIALLEKEKINIFQDVISINDLYQADEIFITNSIIGIQNVFKINDIHIKNKQETSTVSHVIRLFNSFIS
jgi:branched-subunit amino acid aminotransferase/4-amino-4-deoxychorismate lyase